MMMRMVMVLGCDNQRREQDEKLWIKMIFVKKDNWIFSLRLLQHGLLACIYCWHILLASIYFNLICWHIGFGAIDLVPQFASLDRRGKL